MNFKHSVLQTLQFVNDATSLPSTRNSLELLNISTDKLSRLMTRLSGTNLFMKKMEMEEEGFIPVGLDMGYSASGFDEEKESMWYFSMLERNLHDVMTHIACGNRNSKAIFII